MDNELIVGTRMTPEESKELYSESRNVIRFELELIHRRVTWLLASQTLLFAGIGAASQATKEMFTLVYVIGISLGFVCSLGLLLGIGAAIYEADRTFSLIEDKLKHLRFPFLVKRRSDSPITMFFGEGSALLLPLTFVIVWGVLLARHVVLGGEHVLSNPEITAWPIVWVMLSLLFAVAGMCVVAPGLRSHLCKKNPSNQTL